MVPLVFVAIAGQLSKSISDDFITDGATTINDIQW